MQPIHTMSDLQTAFKRKQKLKHLPFWGHRPRVPGVVDAAVLSQWYPAPFALHGQYWATAGHCMMAAKARQIAPSASPAQAKALGRQVQGFDDTVCRRKRETIVQTANHAKFSHPPALCHYLLATGAKVLVEASPVDAIWGAGLPADDQRLHNPLQRPGLKLLGFALMRVRSALQADASALS